MRPQTEAVNLYGFELDMVLEEEVRKEPRGYWVVDTTRYATLGTGYFFTKKLVLDNIHLEGV